MSGRTAWRCPQCGARLGHVTGAGDLVVTAAGVLIERSRTAVVVTCERGHAWACHGRRVLIDIPAMRPARDRVSSGT